MRTRLLLPVTLGILALLPLAPAASALDTIYIVRHADKATFWPKARELNKFHPLSRTGMNRADAIAEHLSDAGIAEIYTSATTRTLATGMPLAEALDAARAADAPKVRIGPDGRTVDRSQMLAFFDELRTKHAEDKAVLVVGHSDTVPLLLIALGALNTCFETLDIGLDGGDLLISGYEGLWRVNLAEPGCAGIERQTVVLPEAEPAEPAD